MIACILQLTDSYMYILTVSRGALLSGAVDGQLMVDDSRLLIR